MALSVLYGPDCLTSDKPQAEGTLPDGVPAQALAEGPDCLTYSPDCLTKGPDCHT